MTNGMGFETLIWTHEERPCRCTPEHRPHCHRCGGSGIVKLARLRRINADMGALTTAAENVIREKREREEAEAEA